MAEYTSNYNLYKPSRNDSDITVDQSLANNFSAIDAEIKSRADDITGLSSELAEKEKSMKQSWINVKDYGAVGDGVTDDTVAFQEAIREGNHLIIPFGDYVVNNLTLDKPLVIRGMTPPYNWRSDTNPVTLRGNLDGENYILVNKNWNNGGNSVYIENIYFMGNGLNRAIHAEHDFIIKSCTFDNFDIALYDLHVALVDGCKFWENNIGISKLTDCKVINNDISRNEVGIDLSNSNSNSIIANRIEWNTAYGIKHVTGVFNTANSNQFDRNQVAFYFENATEINITGNRFDRSIDNHIVFNGINGGLFTGNYFVKRNSADDGSGTNVPANAIKLISYTNINFTGNNCVGKMFDDSEQQYTSGYFIFEGNQSTNIFRKKTITGFSAGSNYIPLSDLGDNVTGWHYDFSVIIRYGDTVIHPTFSYGRYSGITVEIPDNGATSYSVEVTGRIIRPTVA